MSTTALFAVLIAMLYTNVLGSPMQIQAISILRRDEADLHKYAAIMAACEPFLLQRNKEIQESVKPFQYFYQKIRGNPFDDPNHRLRRTNAFVNDACKRYERKTRDIVRSYGLETDTFNDISRRLLTSPLEKKRVLMQSYYYKIAADMEENISTRLPILPGLNFSEQIT